MSKGTKSVGKARPQEGSGVCVKDQTVRETVRPRDWGSRHTITPRLPPSIGCKKGGILAG
eukprot:4794572-Pyramimonas_sp.AAC.2